MHAWSINSVWGSWHRGREEFRRALKPYKRDILIINSLMWSKDKDAISLKFRTKRKIGVGGLQSQKEGKLVGQNHSFSIWESKLHNW